MADKHPWGSDWKTIQLPAPFDSAYRVMINGTPWVVVPDSEGKASVPVPVYDILKEMIDAKGRYPVAKSGSAIAKMDVILDKDIYASIDDVTATCENMTFAKAVEIIKAGEKLDIVMRFDLNSFQNGLFVTAYAISFEFQPALSGTEDQIGFITCSPLDGGIYQWNWTADSITIAFSQEVTS